MLGDAAAAILKDGELVAAVEESKLVRRRLNWGGTANCRSTPSPPACNSPAPSRNRWTQWPWCGPFPSPTSHLKLRARFPNSRHPGGGASHGARRVRLLSFAVRRGHRADARSRRRFPLRLALARRRLAAHARTRTVLPIRSAISTAASPNCSASRPMPTSTRCSGSPSPATTASPSCFSTFIGREGEGRASIARTSAPSDSARAVSARASTSASASPMALRFRMRCAPHIAAGLHTPSKRRRSAWRARPQSLSRRRPRA